MNRDEAKKLIKIENKETYPYNIVDNVNEVIDKIYDEFEKDLKEINNQVSRLKKQLSKDHHIECGCSFCKPVYEKQSCCNCKNIIFTEGGYYCNLPYHNIYVELDFYCNYWKKNAN